MARSQFGWTIMSTSKPATNGEEKSVSFALNFSPLLRLPAFWFSSKQKCILEEVVNVHNLVPLASHDSYSVRVGTAAIHVTSFLPDPSIDHHHTRSH
jgi:hypothetical protein